MPRKLKVFRTPTGFHDAYVAAPSRKAALAAWGADADLFARGTAEEVTDPRLMAEPLRHPGEVIRVSRGDLAAQLKALGPRKKPPRSGAKQAPAAEPKPAAKAAKPPPKRDKVDQADEALAAAQARQAKERATLEKERAAIERQIDALEARHEKEIERIEQRRDKAQAAYRRALESWRG